MQKLLLFLIAIFLFIFSIPYLGETEVGKKYICQFIFQKNEWKVSVKNLKFHWNAPQEFTELIASNGEIEVIIKKGELSLSLLELLKHPFSPIPITLESVTIKNEKKSFFNELLSLLDFTLELKNSTLIKFEKINLSFHEGIYTYPKTNFLILGKYSFMTSGSLDLKNRIMDIEIGPTKKFIESTFKIKNLAEDFFLPFRISGPFGQADVYTEKAFESLGKIILQQKFLGLNKHLGLPKEA